MKLSTGLRFVALALGVLLLFSSAGAKELGLIQRTITVCPEGPPKCDFQKIQDAINAATEGDTIQVQAGTYAENVAIAKSLTLRGVDRNQTKITGKEEYKPAIFIQNDAEIQVVLASLATEAKGAMSIAVEGKAKLTLHGIQISNSFFGLSAQDSALVTLTDVIISTNSRGLWIGGSAQASLNGSIVSGNGDGVMVQDSAKVSLSNSTISGNRSWGVDVGGSAQVSFIGSQVSDNRHEGIRVWDSATVALSSNSSVSGNQWSGLDVSNLAIVSLADSQVSSNGGSGLAVGHSAHVSLTKAQFFGNGSSGLDVSDSATVKVQAAWISDNAGCGISRSDRASVDGQNNWIWYNAKDICGFSELPGFRRPENSPPVPLLDSAEVCPQICQFSEVGLAVRMLRPRSILKIRAGTYQGGVVLVKDLALEGAGSEQTVLSGSTWNGIRIASSAAVSLQDLQVFGNGDYMGEGSITVLGLAQAHLINVQISGNNGVGISVQDSAQLSLTNSQVSRNWRSGLIVTHSATARLTGHSIISGNGDSGLQVRGSAQVSLADSQISDNGRNGGFPRDGIFVSASSAVVNLASSAVSNNWGAGLSVRGSARVEIRSSIIEGNGKDPMCMLPGLADLMICNGIEAAGESQITVIRSKIIKNTDWGVAMMLVRCGYPVDFTPSKIELEGDNLIEGNNTSGNQDSMGNPGWTGPPLPDGQVCLP